MLDALQWCAASSSFGAVQDLVTSFVVDLKLGFGDIPKH